MKSIKCYSLDCRLQSYLKWEVRVCLVLQRRTCIKKRKENTIIHCLELMINSDMVQSTTFVFILCCHHIDLFWGQSACPQDSIVLDGCNGRMITNKNIYIDFGLIKRQCVCTVKPINNVQAFYLLSKNPGYNNCGTGIQITQSDNVTRILRCSSDSPGSVLTNLSSKVEFVRDYPRYSGNDQYCLRIFTNNASNYVTGFCGTSINTTTLARTADFSISTTKSIVLFSTEEAPNRPDTGSRLTVRTTVYSTEINSSQTRNEFPTTKNMDLIVIIAAGAGSCVLLIIIVAIAIILKMLRRRQKDNLLKDEVTADLYAQRTVEQPENTLHQSTDSNDPQTCNSRNAADNRDSGLWVVENTLYKSADEVDDDNQVNPLDIDSTLYSEINDRDNNETKKLNLVLVYDYAYVPENM